MNDPFLKTDSPDVTKPDVIKDVLGYLNFSSGNRDVRFFQALNSLYTQLAQSDSQSIPDFIKPTVNTPKSEHNSNNSCLALRVIEYLEQELLQLSQKSEAFRVEDQAGLILRLMREHLLTAYRNYHYDLLFHQTNEHLFNPFFLAKAFETVLRQGSPWTETERIVHDTITDLNDYIGYRPIPVLEGEEKHQPYEKEWVAPIPLYINGIGTAFGRYQAIVNQALTILRQTNPQILYESCFDVKRLQELVLDSRAYDFDHPVNRKPNYHFGIWDPNCIDKDGYYCRFVIHQVTVDGILRRIENAYTGESEAAAIPADELLIEAGAVLAGTMLMGSGVCGDTPHTYSSETSLTDLMPLIAGYRDRFYEQLTEKIPDKMKPRIQAEKQRLFQPFGGCRQDLNRQLAKRRADQLQRMHLARIFARMGYSEAARHQTEIISVASARMLTQIDCLITDAHLQIDRGKLEEAAENLPKIEELIRSGINCGAIVDPWTILGFSATFSLFHTVENSIHDHRVDELINLLEEIFDLYSRLQKEAAAAGNADLQADLSDKMSDLAGWWDQYGSTEVSGLESFSGLDAWESASVVSSALAVWYKAGTAAGDVAFWNRHVDRFKSTKAYVLLAEALLDQQDPVASMALMMHWLSNSEKIPLTEGDYTFHSIALRWMDQLWKSLKNSEENETVEKTNEKTRKKPNSTLNIDIVLPSKKEKPPLSLSERWTHTKKFFDFTEANADHYWHIPDIELNDDMFENDGKTGRNSPPQPRKKKPRDPVLGDSFDEIDDDDIFAKLDELFPPNEEPFHPKDSIYGAAYEGVTYQDTTDDGIDDSLMDAPNPSGFHDDDDFEIVAETERISDRLTFIVTLSKLWKYVTEKIAGLKPNELDAALSQDIAQYLDSWLSQIVTYCNGLDALLRRASAYKVPAPRGTSDSLLEYDRHRGTKEILLDRIIWTHVELCDAKMILESYLGSQHWRNITDAWQKAVLDVNYAIFHNDFKTVRKLWLPMLKILARETILYVPTSRGGAAWNIVRCRCIQQAIMRLMEYAPRLGLLTESFRILETIQEMEEMNTISPGAITEFDRLVETVTRAITKCVSVSSKKWRFTRTSGSEANSQNIALVEYMERIIEQLLTSWLSHSRQIRISPIESIVDRAYWDEIKQFIQRYGHDIFTQQNMGFGNLRAMLHQGVGNYLRSLQKIKQDEGKVEMAAKLLEDIADKYIDWETAVSRLEIILESIAENYSEYVDYNSTTTHSDHGEKLYMLLDMLRVQIGYERISWNLKPVYWVHDAMIRAGCDDAALLWERAVARRSVNAAEEHLRSYTRLSEKYGMWLPSIHERLQERFVRPLQIDRMCGLVPKAVRQAREEGEKTAFDELYEQIENFAKEPMGVGYEMPEWLTALQDEVLSTRTDVVEEEKDKEVFSSAPHFEQVCLTRPQLEKIIETLNKKERF
ncbi:MAG: hypothetical protein LBP87_01170 [Planctomycetaceae bacterium]|jgi:hypothetical protein|nr:hypothetical protein [Planctomycetaceae bacterium]